MKHKETLMEKMIKRFYGISGVLDEYRLQEIRRIGNNAFIFLFYYILLSNFVAVILMGMVGAEELLFGLCVINALVTAGGVGGYVLYQIHKLELAQIEVTEEQRIPMQRKYAVRCALSGVSFGVLMTIFNALQSNKGFVAEVFSLKSLVLFVFEVVFFGGSMYLLIRYRMKKIRNEE